MDKQELQKVLWDINKDSIDALPQNFIIQRVLTYGGLSLAIKAMSAYGSVLVKQVFQEMKPTSIPVRKYYYLKNFFLI